MIQHWFNFKFMLNIQIYLFIKFLCCVFNEQFWSPGETITKTKGKLSIEELLIENLEIKFQAFKLREWEQLRQRVQRAGQHRQQHESQPRPSVRHPPHHAAAGPDPLRPAAAHPPLAAQAEQAGPVPTTQDVRTGLWKGKKDILVVSCT